MFAFSKSCLKLLHSAGWTSERAIDISHYERQFAIDGHELTAPVRDALRSLGGIRVQFPHPRDDTATTDIMLDPLIASNNFHARRDELLEYDRRIDDIVVPFGTLHRCYMLILCSRRGGFYAAYDDELYLLGPNLEVALETAFFGAEYLEIM
jgi:hypothetical protein